MFVIAASARRRRQDSLSGGIFPEQYAIPTRGDLARLTWPKRLASPYSQPQCLHCDEYHAFKYMIHIPPKMTYSGNFYGQCWLREAWQRPAGVSRMISAVVNMGLGTRGGSG